MVAITSLWIPILVSAVLVFVASSIIHMLLKYHHSNLARVPDEDGLRAAVRPFAIPPGDYSVPHMTGAGDLKSSEYAAKLEEGPVIVMTVMPNRMFNMGKSLGLWFAYCLVVGIFAAYVAGRGLGPGADYLTVFRIVGTVAFLGYGFAMLQDSIWFARKWSSTGKFLFDGLVYALLTAGVFGWLWPSII